MRRSGLPAIWCFSLISLLFTQQVMVFATPDAKFWNLAFGQPVKVSGWDKGFLPEYTVDGLFSPFGPPECWRRSGDGENWIEVTFPKKAQIHGIEVLVARGTPGLRFEAWARLSNGKLDSLGVFDGKPDGNGLLEFELSKPRGGVTGVRLDILDPGFPCIHELGMIGRITGEVPPGVISPACLSAPTIIFHNGPVITMDKDRPAAEAVAVKEDRIWAVGTEAEVMELIEPPIFLPPTSCTLVIDLEGRTMLPGFVDGHSQAIGRADIREDGIAVLLRHGVTTVIEPADQGFLDELFVMEREERLRIRVNAYPIYNEMGLDPSGNPVYRYTWYPTNAPRLDPYSKLRIPAVRIYVDGPGTPGAGCPALSRPYEPDFRATPDFQVACFNVAGDLFQTQEQLTTAVQDIQARGYRVAFLAKGDAAIDQALNAIQTATGGTNWPRHQIHHNVLVRTDQIERYRSLGVLAAVRGYWNTCEQDADLFYYGTDRLPWVVNRFALFAQGVKVFGEGDFAWAGSPDDHSLSHTVNPILTVYGLVTRRQLASDGTICEPQPWAAAHTVDPHTALEMVTIHAAYAASQENVLGSIEVDKLADLIVITDNPLTVAPDTIKDIYVLMTMVGGHTEYCKAGAPQYCP